MDTNTVNDVLKKLKARIGADAIFLVDVNGFLLGRTDEGKNFDLDSIASLSAGNYLSGLELAKLFRITDFQSFFLGSAEKVDYFQIGGEGIFLAVLHPRLAPLSRVVEESKSTLVEIQQLYQACRHDKGGMDIVISDRRLFTPSAAFLQRSQAITQNVEPNRCSFCQKSAEQVKKLVKGPNAMICDECIKLISEVLFIDL